MIEHLRHPLLHTLSRLFGSDEFQCVPELLLVIETLDELTRLGVRVAVDDFGTGYSSLAYLARLPLNLLKIDRSFLQHCHDSEKSVRVVAAIIAMAHILKLRVVAEGIEDREQYAILSERGCDVIQGYLFSRPLPATEIPPLLNKGMIELPGAEPDTASAATVSV